MRILFWRPSLARLAIGLASAVALLLLLAIPLTGVRLQAAPLAPPAPTWEDRRPPPFAPPPALAPAPDFPRPSPARLRPDQPLPPDLSILFISRTPRYNRYCLDYSQGAPELCAGTENEKRFPDAGEPVTLTARIANQGDAATQPVSFTWRLDGAAQTSGSLPGLAAGAEFTLTWGWGWQTGPHTVTLELGDGGGEVTLANNRRDHRTDAHYLEILAHPYFLQAFRSRQNLVGSYSFADWLQAQFEQMNQRLAASVFAETPFGLSDRVRIDVITATAGVGGDVVFGNLAYDGRWTFRVERDYKDTPEDESWVSANNYAQAFANGIDWGLIHELTHQLGVIDLYQLNVSPSVGNQVNDRAGLPLLSGFYWPYPDLMGGDDVRPYDGSHYSPHTALGLRSHSGSRRGYFGEYLFDIPSQVRLRVLDATGAGLPGVRIDAFQTRNNVAGKQPVFGGLTGADGVFLLPNRPVTPTLTTATGHNLHPNPFGLIDVVGRNGQLLLRAARGDQETFGWLTITELNKAFWRGQDAVTLTLPTHFPADAALAPPAPELAVRTSGSTAVLSWQPSPGAASYSVYRGLWPDYYPFQLLASGLTTTSYATILPRTARFGVTAVAADGRESGFGQVARAELLYSPRGLVWEPELAYSERGQLLVVDGHPGSLLRLLPPEGGRPAAWVGRVGSEHIGLVGATGAALGRDGLLAVAVGGGQRAWVLDPEQRIVNWFGRVDDRPSALDQPVGIALAGQPFTTGLPLALPDPAALLLLPFDGDLLDAHGIAPLMAANIEFTPGRFGQAARLVAGSALRYPAPAPEFLRRGGVEFWVRADWPGGDAGPHILLEIGDPACLASGIPPCYRLRLAHESGFLYVWATDFDDLDKAAWGDVSGWRAGEWHHVAATWDEQRLNLTIDGRLAWAEALRGPITGAAATLAVGGTLQGEYAADAAFDDLRFSSFPRLGNSDRVQVFVTEERQGLIKALDLLGNLVSIWAPDDDAIHKYGALALAADGSLWLADEQTQQLLQLRFDGATWQRLATLSGFLPAPPKALAARGDGLLAVAAGDQVLILDPARAAPVLATWAAPNDGSPGPFRQPAALAFGADGDLAVGELGNQRVSFIKGPVVWRAWLPMLVASGP